MPRHPHDAPAVAVAGIAAAVLALRLGGGCSNARGFGASDETALARVEAELRAALRRSAATLAAIAAARPPRAIVDSRRRRATRRPRAAVRAARRRRCRRTPRPDRHHRLRPRRPPLAWAGRVSDLPRERVDGPAALFVAPARSGRGSSRRAGRRSEPRPRRPDWRRSSSSSCSAPIARAPAAGRHVRRCHLARAGRRVRAGDRRRSQQRSAVRVRHPVARTAAARRSRGRAGRSRCRARALAAGHARWRAGRARVTLLVCAGTAARRCAGARAPRRARRGHRGPRRRAAGVARACSGSRRSPGRRTTRPTPLELLLTALLLAARRLAGARLDRAPPRRRGRGSACIRPTLVALVAGATQRPARLAAIARLGVRAVPAASSRRRPLDLLALLAAPARARRALAIGVRRSCCCTRR